MGPGETRIFAALESPQRDRTNKETGLAIFAIMIVHLGFDFEENLLYVYI